jgi:hypothetical protein
MLFFGIQIQFKPLDPDSFQNEDPQRYIVSDCMVSEVNKVTRIFIRKCTQMTPGIYPGVPTYLEICVGTVQLNPIFLPCITYLLYMNFVQHHGSAVDP